MLKSMTGFGRCETVAEGFEIKIQIKSVNHRYSDFTIKTPRYYTFLEDKIRTLAAQSVSRGKVEVLLSIAKKESDDKVITLDRPVAEGYINALRDAEGLGVEDDLSLSVISRFPDVFRIETKEIDEEQIFRLVSDAFNQALSEFIEMRKTEGSRLEEALKQYLDDLLAQVKEVEERSPKCVEEHRERLRARLTEILEDRTVDEARILTEAAIFADKIAVDEETVRLRSHIKAFRDAMETDAPIGKKLDFIVQEMNRETNTIGSKANDFEAASHVVEMKAIIEKIREQIQNIE